MDLTSVLRWAHALAGAAWFGEVMVIAFVLVPVVARSTPDRQKWMLATVFPRLFRLTSVLIATALLAGLLLNLALQGWRIDVDLLFGTRWGMMIVIGGILGGALGIFHFVAEQKLEPMVTSEDIDLDEVVRRLKIVPRVGLAILVVVISLMILA